jgi:hypothetical protein
MDLADFESLLRKELARLYCICDIQIKQRTLISLYATIKLEKAYKLAVFYNHHFNILSFSLVYENKRIWGLDRDNRIGWHVHPLGNAENHEKIVERKLPAIIDEVNLIINKLIIKEHD